MTKKEGGHADISGMLGGVSRYSITLLTWGHGTLASVNVSDCVPK